jgi:hypothetical protein
MIASGSNGRLEPGSGEQRASDLLELADALMERARTLASQADQLIEVLDDAARRLVESGRGVEVAPLPAPVRLVESPQPVVLESANGSAPVSDGARYLITQMAIAGKNHDEMAKRLREDFGMEDADAVLTRVGL